GTCCLRRAILSVLFFHVTPTPPPEIHTLSLHDALPISDECRVALDLLRMHPDWKGHVFFDVPAVAAVAADAGEHAAVFDFRESEDRKSTRLNSSHVKISYAVFCLKKKKYEGERTRTRDD